jgi:hypothetical protein
MNQKITIWTVLFFLIISPVLNAQEWAPVGARWYYSARTGGWQGNLTYTTIDVIGQDSINGKWIKELEGKCQCAEEPKYLYEQNDSIFISLANAPDTFFLFYDFTAEPGDTISIYNVVESGYSEMLVDSLSFTVWEGDTLRVQHLNLLENFSLDQRGSLNIERVGNTGCLVDVLPFCDPIGGPLRCYEEPDNGLFQWNLNIPSCTYVNTESIVDEPIVVSPNPVKGILYVNLGEEQGAAVKLMNSSGQVVLEKKIVGSVLEISLIEHPAGMYFLSIEMKAGSIISKRIIKT